VGEMAQLDMFTVTALDPPWRDNRDTMEFPFLSLQKGRTAAIEYHSDRVSLEVQAPAKYGLASIWDWDIVIFAASHLNDAIEAGNTPSPRVRFVPHDCLKQLGRGTGGKDYRELVQSIRRLRMTTIITNIRTAEKSGLSPGYPTTASPSDTRAAPSRRTTMRASRTRPGRGRSSFPPGCSIRSYVAGKSWRFIRIISN